MYYFSSIIGALIPVALLTGLALLAMKTWEGGIRKVLVASALSLVVALLIGGVGFADGGAFAPFRAAKVYVPAQAIVAALMTWVELRKKGPNQELDR